jgi:hypothetical protein
VSGTTSRTSNPHFQTAFSWKEAAALLTFRPVEPKHTEGFSLQSICVFVRDHKRRELPVGKRSLEAHYGSFVMSQARRSEDEARRLALAVPYGSEPREARIGGHEARVYELGPEPEPDDIDGRSPAVVTWHDGELFFLIASDSLPSEALIKVAASIYCPR